MSKVRAKFRVNEITRHNHGTCEHQTIGLDAVCDDGCEENKSFWEATPNGHIELTCVNLEAANQFCLGKEYYIDFECCETECCGGDTCEEKSAPAEEG